MNLAKPHPDDIAIGPDEWIRFVDIAGRWQDAVDIDRFLRPMEPFWRALEVHCVAECCGISAHGFLSQDIWNGVRSCHDPDLMAKLIALRQHTRGLSAACIRSEILNQVFDRRVFLKLLDHVIATVERM